MSPQSLSCFCLFIAVVFITTSSVDNQLQNDAIRFDGVIDEVRFWTVARTETQIQLCMGQELSFNEKGDCYMDDAILKGYWRFNEGEGSSVADISGGGSSGGMEKYKVPADPEHPTEAWVGGWIPHGAPIVRDPNSD